MRDGLDGFGERKVPADTLEALEEHRAPLSRSPACSSPHQKLRVAGGEGGEMASCSMLMDTFGWPSTPHRACRAMQAFAL